MGRPYPPFSGGGPPLGRPSCTCRPRHDDGARRAKGLKRESFRTSTPQMHHQDRRGPKISSVLFEFAIAAHVWLSHRRPVCSVQGRFFRKRVFFGGVPPPGALVLYIIGDRKTVVPTEKTATNNKVFGLRQFRCTIHAVRVRKVPRFWSDFEEQATSGCHTEGPLCSVHGRFFQDRGGCRFRHFFMFLGQPKKQGRCVTAWTTFGHKILLSQTVMSLQSLS